MNVQHFLCIKNWFQSSNYCKLEFSLKIVPFLLSYSLQWLCFLLHLPRLEDFRLSIWFLNYPHSPEIFLHFLHKMYSASTDLLVFHEYPKSLKHLILIHYNMHSLNKVKNLIKSFCQLKSNFQFRNPSDEKIT